MRSTLLAAVVLVGLNGCALLAASAFASDTSERLGPDTFMVAVGGGAFSSHLDEALLYKCADTVNRAGFDSFTVTSRYIASNGGFGMMNAHRAVAYLRAFKGAPPQAENSYSARELMSSLIAYR
jgi:hypothetical protein